MLRRDLQQTEANPLAKTALSLTPCAQLPSFDIIDIHADLPKSNVYFYRKNYGNLVGTLAFVIIGLSLVINLPVLSLLRLSGRRDVSEKLNMQKAAIKKLLGGS